MSLYQYLYNIYSAAVCDSAGFRCRWYLLTKVSVDVKDARPKAYLIILMTVGCDSHLI